MYYLPVMSRWPSFANKLLHGYFDRDSSVAIYGSDTVFVITEIISDRTGVRAGVMPGAQSAHVKGRRTISLDVMHGIPSTTGTTVDGRSIVVSRENRAGHGVRLHAAKVIVTK
jgi:hypothetical protein